VSAINLNPQYVTYLLELVKKINSSLDLHELLETINEELTQLLQVEASSILVFDTQDQELYFLQAGAINGQNVTGTKVPVQGSIAGWVIQNNQVVCVNDVKEDIRHYKQIDYRFQISTRNLAAIPLLVKGRIIGVLEVINKFGNGFNPSDISFLTELASYIAIALENAQLFEITRNQLKSTFAAFSHAIDKRDSYTHFHSKRVRDYALIIGTHLKLTMLQMEDLELAAILHDVGKIGIRDDILLKPGRLTQEEYSIIKEHPLKGAEILSLLEGISEEIIKTIRHHHERWDGKGYPDFLKEKNIPYLARILSICDVFDALTTDRPYRRRKSVIETKNFIIDHQNKMFDPELVATFLEVYPQLIIKGDLKKRSKISDSIEIKK
jgi:putative nucleotidyltransferase with HDIG domain